LREDAFKGYALTAFEYTTKSAIFSGVTDPREGVNRPTWNPEGRELSYKVQRDTMGVLDPLEGQNNILLPY